MRVIGIDPGTRLTGWGVVDSDGRSLRHVAHGVVKTVPKEPLWERLRVIHDAIAVVAQEHRPAAMSIERCFVSKNIQSALKLGHARGVAMVACLAAGADVFEYAPSEIKSAVAGTGRADKHQVAQMVRVLLALPQAPPEDAADALAAAICHAHAAEMTAAIAKARAGR